MPRVALSWDAVDSSEVALAFVADKCGKWEVPYDDPSVRFVLFLCTTHGFFIDSHPDLLSYPELYLNSQGIPKSFLSHFRIIPESSLSTSEYSQVFPSFPS